MCPDVTPGYKDCTYSDQYTANDRGIVFSRQYEAALLGQRFSIFYEVF